MKKIGVIGTGKTGSQVINLLGNRAVPFNRQNPVTKDNLHLLDGVIVFVSPDGASEVLQHVLDAGLPVVWGTTGFELPKNLHDSVAESGTAWVVASNFSIGMVLIEKIIHEIGEFSKLLEDPVFEIHETHHTEKKDKPSGTALSWRKWLNQPVSIQSERRGDVAGIHELVVESRGEILTLRHEAKDRTLFAAGAVRAMELLLENKELRGVCSLSALLNHVNYDKTTK